MFSLKIKTIRKIDRYIGNGLCCLLSVFNRKGNLKEPKKILVVQLWGIGETILTLPAIKALKNRFPEAKITVLSTKNVKDVFFKKFDVVAVKLNPGSILKFILSNYRKYDLVVDFEEYLNISSIISFFAGKYRVGFNHGNRALLYSKKISYNDEQHVEKTLMDLVNILGAEYKAEKLIKLNYSKEDKIYVDNLLKKNNILKKDLVVGIAAGTSESAKSRMWPKNRFAELSEGLIEKYNAKIVFVGGKKEAELVNEIQKLTKNKTINFSGKTNLKQLFYLIEKCNVFISNDTGPMHIAAAQGVKTIGLFGPNLPSRFSPYGKGNIGIYKGAECSPCINVHKGEVPECKWKGKDYQKCMKKISVEDVLRAFEKIKG